MASQISKERLLSSRHCTYDLQEEGITNVKSVPIYDKGNYDEVRRLLKLNWQNELGRREGIQNKWAFFKDKVKQVTKECVPEAGIKVGPNSGNRSRTNANLPMDKRLWTKIKLKQRLWTRLKRMRELGVSTSNTGYKKADIEYRKINNQVRGASRKAVKKKEREISSQIKKKPKAFWKYAESKMRIKTKIQQLYMNESKSQLTSNDKEKAQVLANQFSKVFVEEPGGDLPNCTNRLAPAFNNIEVTQAKVRKLLKKLKISKSPGPDGIHPRILKEALDELVEPITILFKCSFEQGELPEDWRIAFITAIYKKGDKSDPGNYRPVSLTSIVCKLFESLIREEMIGHMKRHMLFSNKQFGFLSGRSTVLQLIKVIDEWTQALDDGDAVDVIYCDFMKAFDRVPHRRLIKKVESYGFGGRLLKWIEAFLTERRQKVVVNGQESDWEEVRSGVPQGSVLGPLLFVIFINDLPECIDAGSSLYLFADDNKLYRKIQSDQDCQNLQTDLTRAWEWTDKWLLTFHPDKCKYMRIGNTNAEDGGYKLDVNQQLPRIEIEKDLGVQIDDKLSFSNHISEKVNKANKVMGLIRRTFVSLDNKSFVPLYTSLVRPILEYANQAWNPYLVKDIVAIENVQRRATRMLPGMKDKTYEERLKELNLPSLSYRRSRGDMIETFKIVKGHYDEEVSGDIFTMRNGPSTRGHNWRIFKEQVRLNKRKNSFPIRVVNNWNSLPEEVVESVSVNQFKNRLDKAWSRQDQRFNYRAQISNQIRQEDLEEEDLESQAL